MKHRRKIDYIFYGLFLLAAGAFMTLAMPDQAWSQFYGSRSQIAEFEAFSRQHPKAATELQQNPDLVYNRKWLDKNPEFNHFLKGRPELRDRASFSDPTIATITAMIGGPLTDLIRAIDAGVGSTAKQSPDSST
jgi:hypothetical protein